MKNDKHVGVWMDHHSARFIYPGHNKEYAIETMESPHDIHPREDGQIGDGSTFGRYRASNNEYHKHNTEANELHDYYGELKKVLQPYDSILIFGPTTAGQELFNLIYEDKSFEGKHIFIEKTDKLSDNQLKSFVREYFEK